MRVVNGESNILTPLRAIEIGEAFKLDGLLYIKTDEIVNAPNRQSVCMDGSGVLFHFDLDELVSPIKVTLVIGDYNETE